VTTLSGDLGTARPATAPILIDCRCGRTHELDAGRLTAAAVRNAPGHPAAVPLSAVVVR
jgi:hypothetical protein